MDPASTTLILLVLTLLGVNAVIVVLLTRWLVARQAGSEPRSEGQALQHVLSVIEENDGAVATDQEQMLLGVFHFRDTVAREVMTPRRDIIALPVAASEEEALRLVAAEGHSRIPVYAETLDEIVGVLLAKDLLTHIALRGSRAETVPFDLRRLMREPHFVPDSKRIGELLAELRAKSVHMAIVLDEFGGTEGIVTLEDLIEEIVGEIQDEYDEPEETPIAMVEGGDVLIEGGASIFEVNERLGLALPERDFDTIGGYVFGELGRVPVPGDVVSLNGSGELRVEDVEERRVTRLRLVRIPTTGAASAEAGLPSGNPLS
jgi:putative hemolysin